MIAQDREVKTCHLPQRIAGCEPVHSIAQFVAALDHAQPGLAARLNDTIFNFAVNHETLTHGVYHHPIKDGDVVEIVPAISGG